MLPATETKWHNIWREKYIFRTKNRFKTIKPTPREKTKLQTISRKRRRFLHDRHVAAASIRKSITRHRAFSLQIVCRNGFYFSRGLLVYGPAQYSDCGLTNSTHHRTNIFLNQLNMKCPIH
jgi:hypothetical protein